MKILFALIIALPMFAEATCMRGCNRNSKEGTIKITERCAAPGRHGVTRVVAIKHDKCKNGILKQQTCVGKPGRESSKVVTFTCLGECADDKTCIDLGSKI